MEDRNVLRQMERERRNQEVKQEEKRYDRTKPLFSEPYKINKSDELSSRIKKMLGNFEDGGDIGPQERLFPFSDCTYLTQIDDSHPQKSSGRMDCSTPAPETSEGSMLKSGNLPVLSPPVEPLSPLQSSDLDDTFLETYRAELPQMETPLPIHTLPLNLHCKPGLLNPKKPTAYVRPMDGQDQVTNSSPDLKTSPETNKHQPKLKENGSPERPFERLSQSIDIVCHEVQCVESILREMTSWPKLLTEICTPSKREALMSLVSTEEPHSFITHKAHESSETVPDNHISSDSGGISSHRDNISAEDGDTYMTSRSPHTQITLHTGGNVWTAPHIEELTPPCINQPNPEKVWNDSYDSPGRTEGRYSNPTHSDTQAETSKHALENCHLDDYTSTRREKENSDEKRARDHSICFTKDSERKYNYSPLLVKIKLKLLSRIPPEPGIVPSHPGVINTPDPQNIIQHKRTAKLDGMSTRKKQRTDKEYRLYISSSNNIGQSQVNRICSVMKKRVKPKPFLPGSLLKESEVIGKKTCENHNVLAGLPVKEHRTLLKLDHRTHSFEDHMREAKKLKHKADAMIDKMSKAFSYLEAALSFVESGVAMEEDPQTPRSAYIMFSETLELIRFILKLKNYTDPSAAAKERDFLVLCLRCESLLQMTMFRYKRVSAHKHSQTLAEHFKNASCSISSGTVVIPLPIQQAGASYVDITVLFLNALERWEQADEVALRGSGLLQELDGVVGPLTLTSSMSSFVQYARHGLHWIRLES